MISQTCDTTYCQPGNLSFVIIVFDVIFIVKIILIVKITVVIIIVVISSIFTTFIIVTNTIFINMCGTIPLTIPTWLLSWSVLSKMLSSSSIPSLPLFLPHWNRSTWSSFITHPKNDADDDKNLTVLMMTLREALPYQNGCFLAPRDISKVMVMVRV